MKSQNGNHLPVRPRWHDADRSRKLLGTPEPQ